MANAPHYRSQFGDTTFTKVFVGGLAWETPTEEMRNYFQQFGDILEAVIITEKITGKSKGYGFVTFRDPESARSACADPNPVIDGRRANCNIASLGRPRPSPPRGRLNQGANPYQGTTTQQAPPPYSRTAASVPPPPPPVIFPPYGYPTYTPDYGYHTGLYSPQQHQYYQQLYGSTSNPYTYYYGAYSMQGLSLNPNSSSSHRGVYSPTAQPPPQRIPTGLPGSYFYYPSQMEHSYPPPLLQLPRHSFLPSTATTDSQSSPQQTSTETGGAGGVASESPKT